MLICVNSTVVYFQCFVICLHCSYVVEPSSGILRFTSLATANILFPAIVNLHQ